MDILFKEFTKDDLFKQYMKTERLNTALVNPSGKSPNKSESFNS